ALLRSSLSQSMKHYMHALVKPGIMHTISTAGLPALHGSESGQVRKEAATAILCKCRGQGSPPLQYRGVRDVKKHVMRWWAAAALGLAGAPALAVDGVAVEGGWGDGTNTDMGRVAIQWDWKKRWFEGGSWHVGGYWDLGLGYWRRDDVLPGQNDEITEIGL